MRKTASGNLKIAVICRLRLSHYPGKGSGWVPEEGQFGIAPHVDTSFVTVLAQKGPGLCYYAGKGRTLISVYILVRLVDIFEGLFGCGEEVRY